MSTKARFTTTTRLNRTKGGLCFAPLVAILEHHSKKFENTAKLVFIVSSAFTAHGVSSNGASALSGHHLPWHNRSLISRLIFHLKCQFHEHRTTQQFSISINTLFMYVQNYYISSEFFTSTIADRRDCKRP